MILYQKVFSICSLFFICIVFPIYTEGTRANIGVVDTISILTPYKEILKKQYDALLEEYHKEFAGHEKELTQLHQGLLEKQKNVDMQDEDARNSLEKEREAFEEKLLYVQKKAEDKLKTLNEMFAVAMRKIHTELNKVIVKVVEEDTLDFILEKQHVIFHNSSYDKTHKIIEFLSRELPIENFDKEDLLR